MQHSNNNLLSLIHIHNENCTKQNRNWSSTMFCHLTLFRYNCTAWCFHISLLFFHSLVYRSVLASIQFNSVEFSRCLGFLFWHFRNRYGGMAKSCCGISGKFSSFILLSVSQKMNAKIWEFPHLEFLLTGINFFISLCFTLLFLESDFIVVVSFQVNFSLEKLWLDTTQHSQHIFGRKVLKFSTKNRFFHCFCMEIPLWIV